jgi:iron complex outermembrane recepter protein
MLCNKPSFSGRGTTRTRAAAGAAGALLLTATIASARTPTVEELKQLSIEELGKLEVTSVSKQPELLSDAPAAIYVISHDDIIRSGATTIPEMLRLAPNLEVAQLNSSSYAISARGFNVGNNAAMSNKLLVLIDGRTVYTPLFAGVYWDMQTVPPEDIARIEVISGSGGTLYGANAVNGVINIITRDSADTQGGLVHVGAGNKQSGGLLQFGGRASGELTYRIYGEGWYFGSNALATGASAHDQWSRPQGGFRADWRRGDDVVTLEGDDFYSSQRLTTRVAGRNLVGTWQHQLNEGSALQVTAYFDEALRFSGALNGGNGFTVDTYDLSAQHSFKLGGWNDVIWGVDGRVFSYEIENTPSLLLLPATRTLNYASIFLQDTAELTPRLKLTLGVKLEKDPYVGLEPLPQIRLSWKALDNALLWGAVSRAVRAPTPVDRDLIERVGTLDVISGSFDFRSETLIAYELGTRVQVSPQASFSISGFYNDYHDLRSLEASPGGLVVPGLPPGLPLRWANDEAGHVYGVEVWGDYRVTDWWRLSAGFNIQHENLFFKAGSLRLGGTTLTANDPNHQAQLRSYIDFGNNITWDTFLRYVGKLHAPGVPEYVELNTRLGWRITPFWDVSLSGFNLIHSRHPEFVEAGLTNQVPRSVLVESRWRF